MVSNNRIAKCAFSAVRANAASNVQIIGNNCRDCGEVGIIVEFAFSGALIANNIVERAADRDQRHQLQRGRPPRRGRRQHRPRPRGDRPLRAGCAGLRRRHRGRGGRGGHRQHRRGRAALRACCSAGGPISATSRRPATSSAAPRSASRSRVVEGSGSAVISDNLIAGAERGADPRHALDRHGLGRPRPLGRRGVPASHDRAEPGGVRAVSRPYDSSNVASASAKLCSARLFHSSSRANIAR